MLFLGISRMKLYSPGRELADEAIFNGVVNAIESEGYDVVCIPESVLVSSGIPEGLKIDGVFQMSRSDSALSILEKLSDEGIPIFNTPCGVKNCRRVKQTQLLSNDDNLCKSIIVDTSLNNKMPEKWKTIPLWIKRGDSHSIFPDDVVFVQSREDYDSAISSFRDRKITHVVIQPDIVGVHVKFYGISGNRLFRCMPLNNADYKEKFCQENSNKNMIVPNFAESELKNIAERFASILEIDIYGGDAIISSDGKISIIDFNDWPSFSCCINDASSAIAHMIMNYSQENE